MEELMKVSRPHFTKGTVLAITANSGGFRLCELAEDLKNDTPQTSVRFFTPAGTRYSDNCFYKPLFSCDKETIDTEIIITNVKMCSLTRLLIKLPDSEIVKITDQINLNFSKLQTVLPTITENGSANNYLNKDDFDPNLMTLENFELTSQEIREGSVIEPFDILSFSDISNKQVNNLIKDLSSNCSPFDKKTSSSQDGSVYEPSNTNTSISDEQPKLKRPNKNESENQFVNPINMSKRSKKINSSLKICKEKNDPIQQKKVTNLDMEMENTKQREEIHLNRASEKVDDLNSQTSKTNLEIENTKERDNIYFNSAMKGETTKRVYDKRHVCIYCSNYITKVTRHLSLKHKSQTEVAKLLALPDNSLERKNGFIELMRLGDFYHNCNVLATKEGEIVLIRRPTDKESNVLSYNDFGPCPGCTGFMLKKHLWHHTRQCSFFKNKNANRNILQQSNALMSSVIHPNMNQQFKENILDKLKEDNIGAVAKSDETIILFGMMMIDKHDEEQYELTRQSMRQLARLLISLRATMNSPEVTLKEVIKPAHFDEIIVATREVSGIRTAGKKIPSLALKLGYHLQKCVGIVRGQALRRGDSVGDKSCRDFLDLYSLEWQTKISSSALNVMNKSRMNTVNMIPLTSDLMKLNSFLISELKQLTAEAETVTMDAERWLRLAKITLCRFITFNKKRGGEAAKITIQQFASKPDWAAGNHENFSKHLSDLERKLVKELTLIEITGKKKRVVPVLLTEDVNKAIKILISARDAAGVSKFNPFIFARPYNNSLQALRGSDCIRDITSTLKLEKPELINSTKMRKYVATISQVFNLHENEVDWLARHLGHDINVHRNFYRIHHSAIELTKVSKLLMAVDKGKAMDLAGKTLDQISIEDLFNEDEQQSDQDDDGDDDQDDEDNNHDNDQDDPDNTKEDGNITSESDPPSPVLRKSKKCIKSSKKTKSNKIKFNRQPWTLEEKKVVLTYFKDNLREKSLPGKLQYLKLIKENNRLLGNRPWNKIKDFLRNYKRSLNL